MKFVAVMHTREGLHVPFTFESDQDPRLVVDPRNGDSLMQQLDMHPLPGDRLRVFSEMQLYKPVRL